MRITALHWLDVVALSPLLSCASSLPVDLPVTKVKTTSADKF